MSHFYRFWDALLVFTMWAAAGFSLVIVQLNSRKSLRNSFRVFLKKFRILFFYGIVTIIILTIPYLYPGYLDGNMKQNKISNMGVLLNMGFFPKLFITMIYLFLFNFSFYVELYLAESLIGTDLIYNEQQPRVEN